MHHFSRVIFLLPLYPIVSCNSNIICDRKYFSKNGKTGIYISMDQKIFAMIHKSYMIGEIIRDIAEFEKKILDFSYKT